MQKKLTQLLLTGGVVSLLCLGAGQLSAQNPPPAGGGGAPGGGPGGGNRQGGRGNFDPAQMQQRMMDRTKETLEITDDNEWKAIQPLVKKVMDARMAGFRGFGGRTSRTGGGGDTQGGGAPGGGSPFGQSNPDADALKKAIDAKASSGELKAALQKYEAARLKNKEELEKAQAELRAVLTPRQEALATLNGLL